MTARSFLDAGVVDEVQIFRSPDCVGAGGVDALAGLDLDSGIAAIRVARGRKAWAGPADRL